MQVWLVIGYLACFFALVCGTWMAVSGGVLGGVLVAAGGLVGMAILRCLEELGRRLTPPGR